MKTFVLSLTNSILNSNYAPIGLAVIGFAESSFFPIPPDVIMIPLAFINPSLSFFYAGITTISSVIGGLFGYFIGHKGGKPLVNRFISEEKLYHVKLYYNRYDVWAVAVAGLSPIPYKVFTIAAGLFDLNLKRFIFASFLGRGGRFFLIGGLIFFFGPTIKPFLTKNLELLTIVFTLLLIGGFLIIRLVTKSKKTIKSNPDQ